MQSGVISSENVADILRAISQRRRQGILEVNSPDEVIGIRFVQGRVIEASTSRVTPVQETVEWFERAGYPVSDPKEYAESTFEQLYARFQQELAGDFAVSKEMMQAVQRQRILDRLYKLDVGAGSFYTFKVQMVDYEREFAPSISIGQVLLDLVELVSEREEFQQRIPQESLLRPTGTIPAGVSAEEETLLRAVGDGCSLVELERRALLSSYHFRHALLDLLNGAIVSVSTGGSAATSTSAAPDIDSFLSDSIDAAFGMDEDALSALDEGPRVDHDETGTLEELVDNEDLAEDYEESSSRELVSKVSVYSARLLQNSLVPRIVALGFLMVAIFAPFLAWSSIISLFADM